MEGIESWEDFQKKTSFFRQSLATSDTPDDIESNSNNADSSSDDNKVEISRISARKWPTIFKLDRILKSLLDFYISLLNNPTETDEIQYPFIIAIAVLGITKKGFHDTDTYPSKMLAILKVSRFFVLRYSYKNTAIANI